MSARKVEKGKGEEEAKVKVMRNGGKECGS